VTKGYYSLAVNFSDLIVTSVVNEAHSRFQRFKKGDERCIHPNLRGAIFKIVIATGGREEYEAMKSLFQTSMTVDQRLAALEALGYTPEADLIEDAMKYTLTEEVRPQDVTILLSSLSINPAAREPLWTFTKKHFDTFYAMFEKSLRLLSKIVGVSLERFNDTSFIDQALTFFESQNTSKYERALQQALETIQVNADWLQKECKTVQEWASDDKIE
jgi:aminopeptidase 2